MLEKAIIIDPFLSSAHMDLGIVYGEKKKFEKAEEELKKAIELDPRSFEAHNNLAHLYNLQIRRDLALEHWQASLKINPRQPEIRQLIRYVERLKRLKWNLKNLSNNLTLKNLIGLIYQKVFQIVSLRD